MTRFVINKRRGRSAGEEMTVEAVNYRQEGDYFVFYADASHTRKVLTIKASTVSTIETIRDA